MRRTGIIPTIVLICCSMLFQNCDTAEPEKREQPKLPGYQEDIPWPSLADSPWPMYRGDPQNTGRSKFKGPRLGILDKLLPAKEMESSLIIQDDSTIFYVYSDKGTLVKSDFDGTVKWKLEFGYSMPTTPTLSADGTLYVTDGPLRTLYAIDGKSGTIIWQFSNGNRLGNLSVGLGKDGTIYCIDEKQKLLAISKEGVLLWEYQDSRILPFSVPFVFSPDGNTLYLMGYKVLLVAFDLNAKAVKWVYSEGSQTADSAPVVDAYGNIYFQSLTEGTINGKLLCFSESGEIKWTFKMSGPYGGWDIEPCIDKNGNIYCGHGGDTLYSVSFKGELNWKVGIPGYIGSPFVCDAEGVVYVGVSVSFSTESRIMAFSSKGEELFSVPVYNQRQLGFSPAISSNGYLFYPTFRSDYLVKVR